MSEDKENKKKPRIVFWTIVVVGVYYMYTQMFNK